MVNNTDRIDAYLSGEMKGVEREQFEQLIDESNHSAESEELRAELALQRGIITAIQARGLKEQMQAKEKQIRAKQAKVQKIIRITSWSSAISVVAAVMLLVIVVAPMVKVMKQECLDFSQTQSVVRGGLDGEIYQQRWDIYMLAQNGKFSEASDLALETLAMLPMMQNELDPDDYNDLYDEVLWLYTNCEMQQGHVFTAKSLLEQIANSNSYYAHRAKEILEKL